MASPGVETGPSVLLTAEYWDRNWRNAVSSCLGRPEGGIRVKLLKMGTLCLNKGRLRTFGQSCKRRAGSGTRHYFMSVERAHL